MSNVTYSNTIESIVVVYILRITRLHVHDPVIDKNCIVKSKIKRKKVNIGSVKKTPKLCAPSRLFKGSIIYKASVINIVLL